MDKLDPLKDVTDVMDRLSPFKQAEVLDDLLTKYGVPRTLMVDILGLLEIDSDTVESMIADIPLLQR